MRSLVFLLVLGNVIIFSLSAGWVGGREGDGMVTPDESHESHRSLSPDRIRIVSRGDAPPIVEAPKLCLEWSAISAAQATEIEKLIGGKASSLVREETQAAVASYGVYIPAPPGGKAASEKKVTELKKLGVKQFQLVQEEKEDRWNISLGVYSQEAEAITLLAELKKLGVRSAKVGVVKQMPAVYRLRVIGPEPALLASQKLTGINSPAVCLIEASPLSPPLANEASTATAATTLEPPLDASPSGAGVTTAGVASGTAATAANRP